MITYLENTNAVDYLLNLKGSPTTPLLHAVNCQGVMGSGIAKEIKERIPSAYENYRESYATNDLKLGTITYSDEDTPWVVNMAAQEFYGTEKRHLNYGALAACLGQLALERFDSRPIIVPYLMGCGLAGGDWEIVEEMLDFFFDDVIVCALGKIKK